MYNAIRYNYFNSCYSIDGTVGVGITCQTVSMVQNSLISAASDRLPGPLDGVGAAVELVDALKHLAEHSVAHNGLLTELLLVSTGRDLLQIQLHQNTVEVK